MNADRPDDRTPGAPAADPIEESPRVLEVARRLAEGRPVDWSAAGQDASPGETTLIRWLRDVARIVDAHRSVHDAAGGDEAGGNAAHRDAADAPAIPDLLAALDPRAPAAAPAWRWGPLEVLDKVGEGGYGEVYRARDTRLDRIVALKIARRGAVPEARAALLLDEGRLLARLAHPHIVSVFGAERHDGRVGIWMEFLRGRTLSQRLREQGTFGAREAGLIGLDLCRALAAVHAAGLVHRDVKAQNVLREEGGRIVLTDFSAGVESQRTTGDGRQVSGTPLYMAPELFAGHPAAAASDLYALGVLLFHLTTRAFPVDGADLEEVGRRHARGEARRLADLRPDLPPAFVRAIERAIEHDPAARFASAAAMEQALAAALGLDADARPTAAAAGAASAWRRPGTGAGRRRAFAALAAAAIVLAVAAAVLLSRRPAGGGPADAPAVVAVHAPATGAPSIGAVYTVEAAFHRGSHVRERLAPDDRLRVGEALSLDFRASRDLFLYVIDEDDDGQAVLLYPLPGTSPAALAGGATHVLPGALDGRQRYWQVTSAGGREHFLLIASPDRLPDLETATAAMLRPEADRPLQYARLSEQTKLQLRGVAGLVEGPHPRTAPGRLYEGVPRLAAGPESARGAWMRRLDIDNP